MMLLNKSKIEWTDFTWNPVTGCLNDCSYCYARREAQRWKKSFEPEFHPERLNDPIRRKKPAKIFVCSNADLFGPWVPAEWIQEVSGTMMKAPQHTYQLLTKFPERMRAWRVSVSPGQLPKPWPEEWPYNVWCGFTATDDGMYNRGVQAFTNNSFDNWIKCGVKFASLEPLLGPIETRYRKPVLDWLIIGAQTGPGAKQPEWPWVEEIIRWADDYKVPIFLKNNLQLPEGVERRQEFPEVIHG